MMLECLLAEMKCAAHTKQSTRPVRAERVAFAGHLAELWKQHTDMQRNDSRRYEMRAALVRRGMPMQHMTRKKCKKRGEGLCDSDSNDEDVDEAGFRLPSMPKPVCPMLDDDLWDAGDESWPVCDPCVQAYLERFAASRLSRWQIGVRNKARLCRETASDRHIVRDAGDIPASRRYLHRHGCQQLHPGLCCTRDARIFKLPRQVPPPC